MEAEVKQHPQLGRGHALVTLTGAGLPSANVRYSIHRAGSRDTVLGAQGWQAAEAWLVPQEFEGGGERLLLTLGPDVANHMDNANYLISVTGDQVSEPLLTGLAWLDVAPADTAPAIRRAGVAVLEDRSLPPQPQAPANVSVTVVLQQPAQEQRRAEPPPAPPPAPVPPPPPPPPPKPWLRRASMAIILLLLLGGVTWRYVLPPAPPDPPPKPPEVDLNIKPVDPPAPPKDQASDPTKPATPLPPLPDPKQAEEKRDTPPPKPVEEAKVDPAPKPPEPSPPVPVPTPTPGPQAASLAPIEQARAALRETAQPPEQWGALADKLRGQPDGADAAFLLYRNAGTRGHGPSSMLTGSYYDPTDAAPKGTIKADAAQAYAWYKRAAEVRVADVPTRLTRLRSWVEREAAAGSADAKQVLEQWK